MTDISKKRNDLPKQEEICAPSYKTLKPLYFIDLIHVDPIPTQAPRSTIQGRVFLDISIGRWKDASCKPDLRKPFDALHIGRLPRHAIIDAIEP